MVSRGTLHLMKEIPPLASFKSMNAFHANADPPNVGLQIFNEFFSFEIVERCRDDNI